MKNYGPTFAVRRRLGLRWPSNRPPLANSVPHVLFVTMIWLSGILLLGWLQERDAADRAITAVKAAEARAENAEKALVRCLSGNAAFPLEGEMKAVWCDRATVQTL